jgi:molybdenum cofactor cytidylyltransferase
MVSEEEGQRSRPKNLNRRFIELVYPLRVSTGAFGVAILAAGASSRMGRPKMLLPWRETTVLGHSIVQWRLAGAAQVVVVCAEGDSEIEEELDRLEVSRGERIINPDPARGMFSSIQCAARWEHWQSVQHIALSLGDQPHLSLATLRSMARFAAAHPENVCQPNRAGRPRHPVFVPKQMLHALAASQAANLKEFLAMRESTRQLLELDDPALDLDIDTPADYAAAKERFEQASQ